ncbi:MAG: type 4a pilus biogenesis protein PilO [Patescibacteria group bacterium]|nr:type 4a pilus biogenesis protein PilO [Patescibacteria group bacterium]
MSASAKRFYSLLGGVTLFIAAVWLYSSALVPAFNSVQELRGSLVGYQAEEQQLNSINSNLNALSSQYQNISQLQSTVSAILPNQEEIPTIINQLQGLAASSGVNLSSISFRYLPISYKPQGSIVKGIGTIAVSMQGSGNYENFKNFLNALGSNIRIFDLVTLSASVATPSGTAPKAQPLGPVVNYSIVLNTYYQTEATSTPGL